MPLKIDRAPLEQLQKVLPRLLSNLSIGRAQIALEQIRSTLQHRSHDEVLFLVASDQTTTQQPLAAVIAIVQPAVTPQAGSDMATIVHAGFLIDRLVSPPDQAAPTVETVTHTVPLAALVQPPDHESIIGEFHIQLNRHLEQRGIRFVQWATDLTQQDEPWSDRWRSGLGFDEIATLDYLSGEHAANNQDSDQNQPPANPLQFHPVLWNEPSDFDAFAKLVESTYADTLDCPRLGEYRTATETLRAYQAGPAYAPTLWFRITASEDPSDSPIGCLILAQHGDSSPNQDNGDQAKGKGKADQDISDSEPVVEIVYMGIAPGARGQGYGKLLVDRAFAAVTNAGGTKVILGVDRENPPARAIYDRMGLHHMLSETIWARKINSAKRIR